MSEALITVRKKLSKRKLLKKALAAESALVAKGSLKVLQVFEQIEDKPAPRRSRPTESAVSANRSGSRRGRPKG